MALRRTRLRPTRTLDPDELDIVMATGHDFFDSVFADPDAGPDDAEVELLRRAWQDQRIRDATFQWARGRPVFANELFGPTGERRATARDWQELLQRRRAEASGQAAGEAEPGEEA